jgi:multidrug efflux system membrane fusion protein
MRPVTVAQTNEGEVVIASGLAAGEEIVREGQFLLGPGSRIEIKNSGVAEKKEGKKARGRRGRAKVEERGES